MNKPLVSIIIPVFNAGKYLDEAIRSALDQTWPRKEVIVIDDGSTDNSLAIAKTYENKQLKILTQKNKGASAARNLGIKEAAGEYIQFLDADDLLSKNKIESQINRLIAFPDHLALCGTVHFRIGTDPTSYPVQHDWYAQGTDNPVDFLLKLYGGPLIGPEYGGMIQPNAWLAPRSLVLKAGLWNEALSLDDDGEFFCRVILASKGIVYADDAINYYRKFDTNNSLSGRKDEHFLANSLKSTDLKTTYLLEHTTDHRAKMIVARQYYENAFSFYPEYKALAQEAERKARSFAPGYIYRPYQKGIKSTMANLFGWHLVRQLQYLKNKLAK